MEIDDLSGLSVEIGASAGNFWENLTSTPGFSAGADVLWAFNGN